MSEVMKRVMFGGLAAALLLLAGLPEPAVAHEAKMAIAARQAVMKSMGAHLGGIKGAMKAGNGKAVAMHAGAVNGLSKILVGFFPKGSGPEAGVKTRALPAIWQDRATFEKRPGVLEAESAKLAQVAKGGDMKAIGAQLGAMGKNGCGGCHSKFRAKKK